MSCFWRHKWGKWEQYEQKMTWVLMKTGWIYPVVEIWQRRKCIECGYEEREKVSPREVV